VFAAVCVFLIYSAVIYKPWIALASGALLLLGLPLWLASNRLARREALR
jgi:Flp pilus assembly protein TadB